LSVSVFQEVHRSTLRLESQPRFTANMLIWIAARYWCIKPHVLKHPDYTRTRIHQLVERIGERVYPERMPVTDLTVAGPVERISYQEAQGLTGFGPAKLGDSFGPLWATHWFRGRVTVPDAWAGTRVDVLWDSQSEAALWLEGRSAQGLNMTQGDRPDAILCDRCKGGETIEFQVEMACNVKFGAPGGDTHGRSPFVLRRCEIGRFDPQAWELFWDVYVLSKLEAELAKEDGASDKPWRGLLLSELNRFGNVFELDDRQTWNEAWPIVRALYEHRNAGRVMELSVIGHAHIDTAWLWPLAETHRKCERSFSSATTYMRDYPEYRFACSQAYQYAVIKQRNPELYARIQKCFAAGQFVSVGGTWIEPDCNIPSGESLCRQFIFGQRFFQREFGRRCKEFWNPDVFGYNGQLPQIMRLAGITRFLTQKLSWNRFNKPAHHNFTWRGIDGSEVLTHFPPSDAYNAMTPESNRNEITWLRANLQNYRDHDRAHEAIMLYGFGDGGGGPTKGMLEVIRRAADLQGLPRTTQRSSDEFFSRLERDATDLPVMVGELYFEYHRGTYTSQAAVKRNNRRAEQLLHDVEFLAAVSGQPYPRAEINSLWETLLLNQFHDILPGSSIREVYADSAQQFAEFFERAKKLFPTGTMPINTTGFQRAEVVECDGKLTFVEAPPFGPGRSGSTTDAVKFSQDNDRLVLENTSLRAVFTDGGRLISLTRGGREAIEGEANMFELYEDWPTAFDAWDIDPFHLETRHPCAPAKRWEVVRHDPLRVELRFDYAIGTASQLTQIVRLDAGARRLEFHCDADWQESHKLLKVAFPVCIQAMNATYEMQFGHVERPTHYNTSHDLARYEVPMHRWFDFSEHGFGFAILNDCKYGGSTYGHTMRLSLLRAPKSPDFSCDIGRHQFAFAVMPHTGNWREAGVVAEAYRFNQPIRSGWLPEAFASVDDPNLVLDTIKKAEDSDAIVLRFYECHGARGTAQVQLMRSFQRAVHCNILEDDAEPARLAGRHLTLDYRPHQIISLKLI
jgi:alpha-mannosidase